MGRYWLSFSSWWKWKSLWRKRMESFIHQDGIMMHMVLIFIYYLDESVGFWLLCAKINILCWYSERKVFFNFDHLARCIIIENDLWPEWKKSSILVTVSFRRWLTNSIYLLIFSFQDICIIGDFRTSSPNEKALEATRLWIDCGIERDHVTVITHRQL